MRIVMAGIIVGLFFLWLFTPRRPGMTKSDGDDDLTGFLLFRHHGDLFGDPDNGEDDHPEDRR
jgi:hypothetical protein